MDKPAESGFDLFFAAYPAVNDWAIQAQQNFQIRSYVTERHRLFAHHCGGADQQFSLCQFRLQCLHCLARGVRNGNPQYGQGVSSFGGMRSGFCIASGIPTSSNHFLLSAKPQPVIARSSLTAVIGCSELISRKRRSSSAADKFGEGSDLIDLPLHTHDLPQRMHNFDQVALRVHYVLNVFVGRRRFVNHIFILATFNAFRSLRVIRCRESALGFVA